MTSSDGKGVYFSGRAIVSIPDHLKGLYIFGSKAGNRLRDKKEFDEVMRNIVISHWTSYGSFSKRVRKVRGNSKNKKESRERLPRATSVVDSSVPSKHPGLGSKQPSPPGFSSSINIESFKSEKSKNINWIKGETLNQDKKDVAATATTTTVRSYADVVSSPVVVTPPQPYNYEEADLDLKARNIRNWKNVAALFCLGIDRKVGYIVLPELEKLEVITTHTNVLGLCKKLYSKYGYDVHMAKNIIAKYASTLCDGCECVVKKFLDISIDDVCDLFDDIEEPEVIEETERITFYDQATIDKAKKYWKEREEEGKPVGRKIVYDSDQVDWEKKFQGYIEDDAAEQVWEQLSNYVSTSGKQVIRETNTRSNPEGFGCYHPDCFGDSVVNGGVFLRKCQLMSKLGIGPEYRNVEGDPDVEFWVFSIKRYRPVIPKSWKTFDVKEVHRLDDQYRRRGCDVTAISHKNLDLEHTIFGQAYVVGRDDLCELKSLLHGDRRFEVITCRKHSFRNGLAKTMVKCCS